MDNKGVFDFAEEPKRTNKWYIFKFGIFQKM